jgi:hypothetical protein
VNSPPPKPEIILTNFFAEPTVLLVPITSRGILTWEIIFIEYRIIAYVANVFDLPGPEPNRHRGIGWYKI